MTKPKGNSLWFKRRRYGYGWTPVTWQGWTTVGGFLAIVLVVAFLAENAETDGLRWVYLNFMFAAALLLIGISFSKGPSPKWRWGKSDDDKPEEDY